MCAARATSAWEDHGGALRAACFKAAAALGGQQGPSELEAAALELALALEGEEPNACWQEGRCALSLLPVVHSGLATCEWAGGRPCLVMLANFYTSVPYI